VPRGVRRGQSLGTSSQHMPGTFTLCLGIATPAATPATREAPFRWCDQALEEPKAKLVLGPDGRWQRRRLGSGRPPGARSTERGRLSAEPQAHVHRLHRVADGRQKIAPDRVEVDLVRELAAECVERAPGVVPASIEAPIHG